MVKIAIIDDEPMVSNLLAQRLQNREFEVVVEADSMRAIDFLSEHKPDLLLLDVEMPGKCGLEVLKDIRKIYTSFELPVIMVTSHDETDMIVHSFESGANDFITKPVTMEVAIARISTQLNLKSLHSEGVKRKQLEAITAMIVTYNHEINNPLMVGFGALSRIKNGDNSGIEKMEKTLNRIRDLVKKIDSLAKDEIKFESYSDVNEMISLNPASKK